MKKKLLVVTSMLLVMAMCFGCGKKSSKYLLDIDYGEYVTVCDYKNIPATKVTYEITEDEIKQRVNEDLYAYVTYDPVTDRGAKMGDYVNIDYTGSIDGKQSADYSGEQQDFLLGEGYFFEKAEDQMEGMKTGETKDIEIQLDEMNAVNEDDVDKTLSLSVTLNEISVEHLPEYNADFVKENMGFDSIDKYEESVKQDLENSKEEQYKSSAIQEIMNYLYDNSVFNEYPQELYGQCEKDFNTLNQQYADQYEMDLDEYLDLYGIDADAKNDILVEEVNFRLIVGAIAQAEGIDCTDQEVEDFAEKNYESYGYETVEEFKNQYTEEQLGYEALYAKVTQFLYDNAKFTSITEEEYIQQQMEDGESDDSEVIEYDESELVDEPIATDGEENDTTEAVEDSSSEDTETTEDTGKSKVSTESSEE